MVAWFGIELYFYLDFTILYIFSCFRGCFTSLALLVVLAVVWWHSVVGSFDSCVNQWFHQPVASGVKRFMAFYVS